jgi:hypothetical protein
MPLASNQQLNSKQTLIKQEQNNLQKSQQSQKPAVKSQQNQKPAVKSQQSQKPALNPQQKLLAQHKQVMKSYQMKRIKQQLVKLIQKPLPLHQSKKIKRLYSSKRNQK